MTVFQLKEELRARGESTSDNKAWLHRRLHAAIVGSHLATVAAGDAEADGEEAAEDWMEEEEREAEAEAAQWAARRARRARRARLYARCGTDSEEQSVSESSEGEAECD